MSDTLKDIQVLKEKFPLFEYKMVKPGLIQVMIQSGVAIYVVGLGDKSIKMMTKEHKIQERWKEMMDKYPHLYFSRDLRSMWVRREVNGKPHDGDGIPYKIPLTDDQLPHWNDEAGKARQQGWFLCFICGKAKPRSEYGYYHFCAEYCKDCLAKNPDVERSARNENYE